MKKIETAIGTFLESLFSSANAAVAYQMFFKMVIWTSCASLAYTIYNLAEIYLTVVQDYTDLPSGGKFLISSLLSCVYSFLAIVLSYRGRSLLDQNESYGFWYLLAIALCHVLSVWVLLGFYGVYSGLNKKFREEKLAHPDEKISTLLEFFCLVDPPNERPVEKPSATETK